MLLSGACALLTASVLASPLAVADAVTIERRAGPSGTLLSPAGGFGTVSDGGTIPVIYQGVHTSFTSTSAIDVTLVNKAKGYSHQLATGLTFAKSGDADILATFLVPTDAVVIAGFRTDYQLVITEYQVTGQGDPFPGTPFRAAAPFISISFAG